MRSIKVYCSVTNQKDEELLFKPGISNFCEITFYNDRIYLRLGDYIL